MTTREEAIAFCLTFPAAYEDYPFDDPNWTVMRRQDTKKGFAWIFEREGHIWVNLKAEPEWVPFWVGSFESIVPAYHMNKKHWISVILDGTVPEAEITARIADSFRLCGKKTKE